MLKKSNGRKLLMCMSISLSLAGTYTILSPQTIQAYAYLNQQGIQSYVTYGNHNYTDALKNYEDALKIYEDAVKKYTVARENFKDAEKNYTDAENKLNYGNSANKHFEIQWTPLATVNSLVEIENALADDIISTGKRYLKRPFKFGAKTGDTSQFDASSFTQYVYGQHGIKLPRTSVQQAKCGVEVNGIKHMQKGDLLYFKDPNHIAIYMGNNKMLNARSQSNGVAITTLNRYWIDRLEEVRRVI